MARDKTIRERKHCRICHFSGLEPFLDLGSTSLPNGFLKKSDLDLSEPSFPLVAGFCPKCFLVQLIHTVDPAIMFRNYVYIPSASWIRLENFRHIVEEASLVVPIKQDFLAVDIGSNDGSLLVEFKKKGVKILGIDPAENLAEIARLKGVETIIDYFSLKTAHKIRLKHGRATYITATNVLAHIDDIHGVFLGVKELLDEHGIFICEFPYLVDLLEKRLFDTIYHEHLSYFSVAPLLRVVKQHGLKLIDIRRTAIDGGALRLTITSVKSQRPEAIASIENLLLLEKNLKLDRLETYHKFAHKVYKLREDIRTTLGTLKKRGKTIIGYGASARGNILLGYCGLGRETIDFIVDSTPYKQGLFTPGHHIPICPEETLISRRPDYALILAWNFASEIMEKQKEFSRLGGEFIIPVPKVKISKGVLRRSKKLKVVVVMPAYNAAKTMAEAYRKLPKDLVHEVILIDDCSQDNTAEIARKLPITVYRNEINLGYGGNLKVCLTKALEAGADIVIEYHPDDQYDPKDLSLFIEKAKGGYDFALGSRFIFPKQALENKMPLVKFIANRAMSFIDELILGIEMSEFHSGFRMYTRKLLESVPFRQNSDDYLFSFEIIAQTVYWGFLVAEVPISCRYHPAMHTANLRRSAIYALGTFKTLGQYMIAKFLRFQRGPFLMIQPAPCPICKQKLTRFESVVSDAISGEQFSIFFCSLCQIGFTIPTPKDLAKYYPKTYYSPMKSFVYRVLQFRRPRIIQRFKHSGVLLDIGCGDGSIHSLLPTFDYHGVETAFAGTQKKNIQTTGVEKMKIKDGSVDVVTFWESLEHVKDPLAALEKSFQTLKQNGILIIECPNYSSGERLLFGSHWFHLDPPRHLTHFTPRGLAHLVTEIGFKVVEQRQLFAPEYTPVGLAQSMLYLISPRLNLVAQGDHGMLQTIAMAGLIGALLTVAVPLSVILYLFTASPILLTVARKHEKN